MAANETFSLCFNDFKGVVESSWKELQRENAFYDLTLACEERQIETHKFVISAFSPVLRNILKSHQTSNPLIYLRKVKYIDLQNLISFMYQGEVEVAEENHPSFLEAAEDLNIRGLFEANTEGCNSSRKFPSEPTYEDIVPSLKRKRNVESQKKVKITDDNPFDESEFQNPINDNDKNISNINSEVMTQKYDKSSSQNIVSTFTDKEFHCLKCDKSFTLQYHLNRHNRSSHEGEKYPCIECNYKAKRKDNLQQHVTGVHGGVKYPCTECNYKAGLKHTLQQHVKAVHEGIKYSCTDCNYKATTKGSLNRHVAENHA